jgi:hypothetical protein
LGDGTATAGFLSSVNANTAAGYSSTQVTITEGTPNTIVPSLGFGKYYSAADTIDVLFNNTPGTAGIFNVWAIVADCS